MGSKEPFWQFFNPGKMALLNPWMEFKKKFCRKTFYEDDICTVLDQLERGLLRIFKALSPISNSKFDTNVKMAQGRNQWEGQARQLPLYLTFKIH